MADSQAFWKTLLRRVKTGISNIFSAAAFQT